MACNVSTILALKSFCDDSNPCISLKGFLNSALQIKNITKSKKLNTNLKKKELVYLLK